MDVLKDAHNLYYHRGRIIHRLSRASVRGLARFADALEALDDDELDMIALECERMVIEKMKKADGDNSKTECL